MTVTASVVDPSNANVTSSTTSPIELEFVPSLQAVDIGSKFVSKISVTVNVTPFTSSSVVNT